MFGRVSTDDDREARDMPLPFSKKTRQRLKQAALIGWVAAVAWLVIGKAGEMDWTRVLQALGAFEPGRIAVGFALVLPALAASAAFDLIGRHATGHGLPLRRVMLMSFTGFFFSLNLGALVGGLAFRYRLYMPYGLSGTTISQVIGLTVITNWSGYVPMAGAVLAWRPPEFPAEWGVSGAWLRAIGWLLLGLSAAYIGYCAWKGGSAVRWKDSEVRIPTLGIAAVQVALSMASWGSIGAVIAWLLPGDISWFAVMPVLMISAIAGIWSHVPSGLGVVELVFVTLLGHRAPESGLLAAILVYRIIYYLVPFAVAIAAYVYLEVTAKRRRP